MLRVDRRYTYLKCTLYMLYVTFSLGGERGCCKFSDMLVKKELSQRSSCMLSSQNLTLSRITTMPNTQWREQVILCLPTLHTHTNKRAHTYTVERGQPPQYAACDVGACRNGAVGATRLGSGLRGISLLWGATLAVSPPGSQELTAIAQDCTAASHSASKSHYFIRAQREHEKKMKG